MGIAQAPGTQEQGETRLGCTELRPVARHQDSTCDTRVSEGMGRGGHGVAVSDMNVTPHPSLSRAASLTGHA